VECEIQHKGIKRCPHSTLVVQQLSNVFTVIERLDLEVDFLALVLCLFFLFFELLTHFCESVQSLRDLLRIDKHITSLAIAHGFDLHFALAV
jgi:hypothetical protein